MTSIDEQAWGEFWQARSGRKGCLPEGFRQIDAVQQECWEAFARGLPKRARLLDLATGNGAVLSKMLRVRRDLKAIGVDSSPVLPAPPSGAKLKANIAMEKLPFAEAAFDAVTSQFGIEYSDVEATAPEVGRVLCSGGRTRLIIHHADSPVLAHNRTRREGLNWAVNKSGYLDRALSFARARLLAPLPTPASFRNAVAEARRLYPNASVAEEFVTAILQTLDFGRRGRPQEALEVLKNLEREAANEIARIESLERAACNRNEVERLREVLRAAEVDTSEPQLLFEISRDIPFGWLVDGTRR